MKIPGGYIIAIEGIDAAGKNTQSVLLSKWLGRHRIKTTAMSFPDYDTPIGREIKSFLSGKTSYPTELQHLLFAANRWEKFQEIKSRLRAGEALVVNRYTESNLAYGSSNGLDIGWLASLEKGMPRANIVIVLDAHPHSLGSRRPCSSKDAYERSDTLQTKAQKAYRELARKRGWKVIDAGSTIQDVQTAVVRTVTEALERDRGISV